MILLDAAAARRILQASAADATSAEASLDLGLSTTDVELDLGMVRFPDRQTLPVEALRKVVKSPSSVYTVLDEDLEKLTWHSPETDRVYTLRATGGWPALEISGILMHRVKDTDPRADAESKIATVAPLRGRVLETCCGLGYSALHAARTADHVTAFEVDPNVLEMARLNPYSAPLFRQDANVEIRNEDVAEAIHALPDEGFDAIIHDPPTLTVAGELYGDDFYRHLLRVLRPGGRLFHYTGDPGSHYRKQDLPGRVAQRLGEVGFVSVRREPEALGVSARKRA